MAETTLQGIWTQKGLDKETAFRAGGERKKLTHVAVGDGNGSLPIVRAAQTSLVHEVWRGLANAVMVNPDDPTDLLVDAVIPNNVGGFWIREWGIFDEDGDLVAVGPHDEMHKPLISTGQAAEFLERFHLPSANATFVEIKIASQALATQQYVEHEVDVHNKDSGAHETLARKNVQIKAGTGLSGGGTLEADRTLVVTYGNAAGTACQGNDVRLSDARTPKAHTSTATTYGAASDTQYGHAKASGTTPKAPGTAAVGTEKDTFARGDHVHPAQTTVSGKAGSATKLDTARTIDGVSFNGSANITHYGTCSTAAATVEKAVPLTGFTLATGAVVRVKFTVTNTAASPTLNVASTGAKPLYYRGAAVAAGTLAANRTYEFVYNGTQYELVGDVDTNTTYTPAAAAPKAAGTAAVGTSSKYAREDHVHPEQTTVSGNAGSATKLATARTIDGVSFNGSANITHYGSCATEAATAAKVVACTGFALATGSRITVRFTVTNTSASPTLNVNGTGAKALRYRNAAIAAGYLAANRTYDFVYDGTYYQLVGDINTDSTAIPKGTRMLFYQASAPSGWTQLKDTELTDATIRLVTGGAGVTEGSRAFQDVFKDGLASTNAAAGGTVGNTTLTESQMPSHRHSITTCADNGTSNSYPMGPGDTQRTQTNWTANTGGSGAHAHSFTGTSHNHSLNLNVKRATCMVCSKN